MFSIYIRRSCVLGVRFKKFDYDHYIPTIMLPKSERNAVMALRALNVEIARVRESVKTSDVGEMRFMWWKEQVNLAFNEDRKEKIQHPVVEELAEVLRKYKLPKLYLQRLIDRRVENMKARQPATIAELETYAEGTSSALLYLTLKVLDIDSVHADHAASHLGKAEGLVTVLRSLPFHISQRRLFVPAELCAKHKISTEDVFSAKAAEVLKDAVFDIASAAKEHVLLARQMKPELPKRTHYALLSMSTCDRYLDELEKKDFDVFQKIHTITPVTLLRIWKNSFTGSF